MGAPDAAAAREDRHRGNDLLPTAASSKHEPAPKSDDVRTSRRDSVDATYASLVQQYLGVNCVDNATFLAERMVARKRSDRALYLLATCHYRAGSASRARAVLLSLGVGGGGAGVVDGDGEAAPDGLGSFAGGLALHRSDAVDVRGPMRYLLARCCLDLKLYGEAEECLLRECRAKFRSGGGGASGGGGNGRTAGAASAGSSQEEMYEWIAKTSPCPIPNGAAGLNLLGTICQKSNRRHRAIDYYRLSLKLDPLMWTSYQALCEMGANEGDMSVDDPTEVFGVSPPGLAGLVGGVASVDHENGQGSVLEPNTKTEATESPAFSLSQTPIGVDRDGIAAPHTVGQVHGDNGHQAPYAAPSTPFDPNSFSAIETGDSLQFVGPPGSTGGSNRLPAASLFNTGGRHPPSTSGRPAATPHGPAAALFNTPDLTPIQKSDQPRDPQYPRTGGYAPPSSSSVPGHHAKSSAFSTELLHSSRGAGMVAPDSANVAMSSHLAIARTAAGMTSGRTGGRRATGAGGGDFSRFSTSSSKDVIDRARQVAARLYYEPSPEMTPPDIYETDRSSMAMSLRLKARHRTRLGGLAMLSDDHDDSMTSSTDNDLNVTRATTQSRLSFSSSSMATPCGPNGLDWNGSATAASHMSAAVTPLERGGGDGAETTNFSSAARNDEYEDEGDTPDRETQTRDVNHGESSALRPKGDRKDSVAKDHVSTHVHEPEACAHGTDEHGGVQEILELLCTLGAGHRLLCQYQCKEALTIFHQLPHSQFLTGWVQHQVGRAYFEMADYPNAQRSLETMQHVEPHRVKGLEVLSTTLWHLKKEVELSHLAQRAVDFDRMSPESWCVVGNCFSLQKEHETALTFFRRSVQLDPTFTYSHTLSGHEYVSNEDFDRAVSCYRDAIRVDDRHYNAWYGLGAIYFRQEKYNLAEYHFRKALSINPQSSVLHCHLGQALHASGKEYEALDALSVAFQLDPRNPQARYQRATIWMTMDQPLEALAELEKVRDAAPREASVHFAMGRVLKRLGRLECAMRSFLTALDLDPKDNNLIKAAMDRLDEPDVDEEVSAF